MPRALLSVSDKTGLVDLARGLVARGFELVSTGGTSRALSESGLAVTSVSAVTGFPEMMDGRVKTLHPAVHAGILARRDRADDLAALDRHGLALIDLVVVNLYPFVRAASDRSIPFDGLIEEIDIGGPSLVRAAAKNFRGVLVVVDPADYAGLLAALDSGPTLAFRFGLMGKAFAHTAAYDAAIARTLGTWSLDGDVFERGGAPEGSSPFASRLELSFDKVQDLRYGENPHQRAAWYRGGVNASLPGCVAGFGAATILQGKEPSFTNLLDLDAAARIVSEFAGPAAAIIKHTNPCGAATSDSPLEAYVHARDTDPLAAFGGIVALNRPIDRATAEALTSTFIEAVVAPAVVGDAREILARKANMRVVIADCWTTRPVEYEVRTILGGALVQERDRVNEAERPWRADELSDGLRVVTRRPPDSREWQALRFAWRICAHVKSNAVIFTDACRTLAVGAGQMSRVDAVNVAVMKAASPAGTTRSPLSGSVAASDAYFPFRDGLDAVARAGATAVVQPGGSRRDDEVIAAADEHGLAMVFAGRRHFRH